MEKHIDIVQSTIARMSNNSFLIKGWCITLVAGLCAIGVSDDRHLVYLLAYVPIVLFGFMDAYYLWIERCFRELYNDIVKADTILKYSMEITQYKKSCGYLCAFFSWMVLPFYTVLAGVIFIIGMSLKG